MCKWEDTRILLLGHLPQRLRRLHWDGEHHISRWRGLFDKLQLVLLHRHFVPSIDKRMRVGSTPSPPVLEAPALALISPILPFLPMHPFLPHVAYSVARALVAFLSQG